MKLKFFTDLNSALGNAGSGLKVASVIARSCMVHQHNAPNPRKITK